MDFVGKIQIRLQLPLIMIFEDYMEIQRRRKQASLHL